MRLSEWRPAFTAWVQQKLPINDWTLNAPDRVGKVAGLVPPLRSIRYSSDDEGVTVGRARQELFVVYNYAPDTRYIQLPLSTLEGVYQTLSLAAMRQWQEVADDLLTFEQVSTDEPIVVRMRTDERKAWNVELCWIWDLTFTAEPETPFDSPDITTINSAIWRSSIQTFDDRALDSTTVATANPVATE